MSPSRAHLTRPLGRLLAVLGSLALLAAPPLAAQNPSIRIVADASGARLQVGGQDVMVRGMNWDYFPVGTNYSYTLWNQPDAVIIAALAKEMPLLKAMGVNVVRQYNGIPPRWVKYIYETYGIWTVLNHAVGRYGVTVNGAYSANTDYSDPKVRAQLVSEITALVREFQGTPGLLMWLLGNENNYGLVWKSAETENLPVGERDAAKARYLYSLFGEVVQAIKAIDREHPVAMANGDLQYIDIIAQEVKGLDVFGTNVYRGASFGDLFQVVKEKLNLPVMFTEFGADAWNARENREDQLSQARYLLAQWQEIYEQSAGKGGVGNAIGGMTFQWSDGWWKFGQEDRLDQHDSNASWSNQAYGDDWTAGENNMNEEWWGVVAKGPADSRGLFELYPRAAYYALQQVYALPAYGRGTDRAAIQAHFAAIDPTAMVLRARGDLAARGGAGQSKVRISGMRLELSTFNTGGSNISTPEAGAVGGTTRPASRGFDHLESYFAEITAQPTQNVTATLNMNVLGNVPLNPINELFYEARGRARVVDGPNEQITLGDVERLRVYRASFAWDEKDFRLDGFYRTGHYHWGYEGDFFGLYREANYGPNIDIYGGEAPQGFELTGKRKLAGLKVAFGPELWWGANPQWIAKYTTNLAGVQATALYQDEFAQLSASSSVSSFAVPLPATNRASIHLAKQLGSTKVEWGGLWSGGTKEGQAFQVFDGEQVLQDRVKASDAFGTRAKVTVQKGRWNWYAQGAAMGVVADGFSDQTMTFTGWQLRDSGLGNQWNAMTGFSVNFGNWSIAPNVLWQKPIVGPVPADAPQPARPRNVLDDPFAVRANREQTAAEVLVTWDPTPATFMYAWDTDNREDAKLAVSVGATYRSYPTTQDAAIGILADGRTLFAFPGATPARDLWEVRTRIVSRVSPDTRLIANAYAGTAEPTGNDQRKISRYGGDLRLTKGSVMMMTQAKFNDWGPYDYHRDFNLTFPTQLMADVSYVLGLPQMMPSAPQTRFGVRGIWRSLDRFSPRFCPAQVADNLGNLSCDPTAPGDNGSEWEVRTYVTVGW
jgi:beta-galactosidase